MDKSTDSEQRVKAHMGMLEPEVVPIKPVVLPKGIMPDRRTHEVCARDARSVRLPTETKDRPAADRMQRHTYHWERRTMPPSSRKTTPGTRQLSRRTMLCGTGATVVTMLIGSGPGRAGAGAPISGSPLRPTRTAAVMAPACVVRPEQTEGPYFVDERLNRSDIRSDPSDGSVQEGVLLRLAFHVSRIAGDTCTSLEGAIVDVWHCDALGRYSDVQDSHNLFDTRGKQFLRGSQLVDARGSAQFTTVYPGWYPGRTVHIHVKIRTDPAAPRGFAWTSQLYFEDALTDQVHAQPPYANNGPRRMTNDRDGLFRSGGRQLLLQLTKEAHGYGGTFEIGLQIT